MFKLKYLGELKYFLGIELLGSIQGVMLNQIKYLHELISEIGLSSAKPTSTPLESIVNLKSVEFNEVIGLTGDVILKDVTLYQRLVAKLMYTTITKPVINYVV